MRSSVRPGAAMCALWLFGLAVTGCGGEVSPVGWAPRTEQAFEGSWNAAGTRRDLSLGGPRRASLLALAGTMILSGAGRPGVGFRAEVIAFVDTETGLVGRSVWTDEHGDRVFGELSGQGTAAKHHLTGTIFGGTGRYAGATGSYEFTWQYVLEAEDGRIQGRAVDLVGRVRLGEASR